MRFQQRIDFVLGVLHIVRMWAARDDALCIHVYIGRVIKVRTEQLEWLDRRFFGWRGLLQAQIYLILRQASGTREVLGERGAVRLDVPIRKGHARY